MIAHLLENAVVQLPPGSRTWSGFRTWAHSDIFPERGRISFVDREIFIDMSPEEIETHNKIKSCVSAGIHHLVETADLGEVFVDGALLTHRQAQLATEPDATFVRWSSFEKGRVRLLARKERQGEFTEVQGRPDWVLEVVSVSSQRKDRVILREAYHQAGIPEYWLIDALGDAIDFRILVRRRQKYVEAPAEDGWIFSPVFGKKFRLTRRRNRAGRWRYTLESADVQ